MAGSDLARVAGAPSTIDLDGGTYEVLGKLKTFAAVEQQIIKLRGNPFDLLTLSARGLGDDPSLLERVLTVCVDKLKTWRFVEWGEYNKYVATADGLAFLVWNSIKHNDPALTLEVVREKVLRHIMAENAALSELYVEEMAAAAIDTEDQPAVLAFTRAFDAAHPIWRKRFENAIEQASGIDELGKAIGIASRATAVPSSGDSYSGT